MPRRAPDLALAVYTTIYPAAEAYLIDWYHSLLQQTDQDFELWIGLDMLGQERVQEILGGRVKAHWTVAPSGATVAQVRQHALARIVETCSSVVLVDSDDLLDPTRVGAARASLNEGDLAGCALCLVDQDGNDLGETFDVPQELQPDDVFPRNNVFGFSNSAFRTDLLRRCLPIPSDAVLVDWFLATRAWLLGAELTFDHVARMAYRQHPSNTARVRFPCTPDQVLSDTKLVRQHFALVLAHPRQDFKADRVALLRHVSDDIDAFHRLIASDAGRLNNYVQALNELHPDPLWWATVANPALDHLWKS
jgi:hypothetical protein